MTIARSLGEKLRKLRRKDRKTMEEASLIFGVSLNTLYRWEHDKAIPRKYMLEKVAEYYNLPLDYFTS